MLGAWCLMLEASRQHLEEMTNFHDHCTACHQPLLHTTRGAETATTNYTLASTNFEKIRTAYRAVAIFQLVKTLA